jgi:tetratricopeptide (TPR) repeat protein
MAVAPRIAALAVLLAACACVQKPQTKIPITTSSGEARELYVGGRDLLEKLRVTDARERFQAAVQKDPKFALAYVGIAHTAASPQEFFDALERAVALVEDVSEGERHVILELEAGAKSDPGGQRTHLERLVEIHPEDERAHGLLANFHFALQEWEPAIHHYREAIRINPEYAPAYNQLGYAYRYTGRYAEAEAAFQKYIDLIPNEPNPYDSYAELLMKTGRFEESIEKYRKALEMDATFFPSYVGIGNDQIFQGKFDEARATFRKLFDVARRDVERRQALFWTAMSYAHEERYEEALEELRKRYRIAEAGGDRIAIAGHLAEVGDMQFRSGDIEGALATWAEAMTHIRRSDAPAETKAAAERTHLYLEARAALERRDLRTARAKAAEHHNQVMAKRVPMEIWRDRFLAGMIAMAGGDDDAAIAELEEANHRDPEVLLSIAEAWERKGDAARARAFYEEVANFNGLSSTYAFVRHRAQRKLAER